ncbi:sporulation protein YjcZ [Paenibacillus sp. MMS18-CY102]|nr:sporulation protein YjcZ [Paenibacillus sp. MMS18-CY102]
MPLEVQTKDYGYDGYGYGGGYGYGYNPWGTAFAIDLALIAFLFLLL